METRCTLPRTAASVYGDRALGFAKWSLAFGTICFPRNYLLDKSCFG
jgi:hypothetical protein